MNGREHVVKVIDGGAELEKKQDGRPLFRLRITAEVDGVKRDYTITFGRYNKNAARGRAYASADAPARRLVAVIKALTGREPGVYHMKDGTIIIERYEGHLKGFMRYAELADAIERWLEETGR